MSAILSTPNTSTTPDQPGHWVVTEFGTPSVLKWESWDPNSEFSADKVLVRIIVVGIAGVDNIQRAGGYPLPQTLKPGFTTGYDCVGEVVALGDSVPRESGLAVGDRVASVCITGAHATHIVLSYTELIRIEHTDDPVKVATLPLNYMTAWGMLKHSGVQLPPGSSILIGSASGGLGTAVAQLVTAFDMDIKMIGTCSPSKFNYLRSLGVEPVDRNAPDLVEQVRALTDGEGVDVAYDGVCSEASLQRSLSATKADVGRVVVFGVMSEIATDGSGMQLSVGEILASRLQPRMSFYGVDLYYSSNAGLADFYGILEKVRSGKLEPVIAKLFRLSEAVEAHEDLISGSIAKGKMLFIVDADLAAQHDI
ncbi:GroES-like protein [Penicillium samsonianum]|uniref:GroES-like protein n=1 Tax=Penicillium samsonianum TaxID=1882272 RepID=UPI002546A748|nr:GroES-like protein [Penicillium samsonianum]KAJ6142808.1 GroES-like protein [Penicillium samsonianum]